MTHRFGQTQLRTVANSVCNWTGAAPLAGRDVETGHGRTMANLAKKDVGRISRWQRECMSMGTAFRKWSADSRKKVYMGNQKPSTSVGEAFLKSITPRHSPTKPYFPVGSNALGLSGKSLRVETTESGVGDPDKKCSAENGTATGHASELQPSGFLSYVCVRPAGTPEPSDPNLRTCESGSSCQEDSREILPWTVGFLPQTLEASFDASAAHTEGVPSMAGRPMRSIDIGGGSLKKQGREYSWKLLGALGVSSQSGGGAVEWTAIGISSNHRMAGGVANLGDVAVCMDGCLPEIQNWLQGGRVGGHPITARDCIHYGPAAALRQVAKSHDLWQADQSERSCCTCLFGQAWGRISAPPLAGTPPSEIGDNLYGPGRCICQDRDNDYDLAWAEVGTESDPKLNSLQDSVNWSLSPTSNSVRNFLSRAAQSASDFPANDTPELSPFSKHLIHHLPSPLPSLNSPQKHRPQFGFRSVRLVGARFSLADHKSDQSPATQHSPSFSIKPKSSSLRGLSREEESILGKFSVSGRSILSADGVIGRAGKAQWHSLTRMASGVGGGESEDMAEQSKGEPDLERLTGSGIGIWSLRKKKKDSRPSAFGKDGVWGFSTQRGEEERKAQPPPPTPPPTTYTPFELQLHALPPLSPTPMQPQTPYSPTTPTYPAHGFGEPNLWATFTSVISSSAPVLCVPKGKGGGTLGYKDRSRMGYSTPPRKLGVGDKTQGGNARVVAIEGRVANILREHEIETLFVEQGDRGKRSLNEMGGGRMKMHSRKRSLSSPLARCDDLEGGEGDVVPF